MSHFKRYPAVEVARWEAIRRTVPCVDCHGEEWMMEPEVDFPGYHCGSCTDGCIDMGALLATGAAFLVMAREVQP